VRSAIVNVGFAILCGATSLSGCSSATPNGAIAFGPSAYGTPAYSLVLDAAGGNVQLYVSEFKASSVSGYSVPDRRNRGPVCAVAGVKAVNGVGVDRSGTLWVPQQNDNGGTNSVTSYAPHCGAPGITLHDSNGYPWAIAFDSKGTNYVMDSQTAPSGPGAVLVYRKGATSRATVLTDPAFRMLTAIGVDANDNVYVATTAHNNHGAIVEFKNGKMPGRLLIAVATPGIPGGTLLFDRSANLIVDEFSSAAVEVFAPPYGGSPRTFQLKGTSWQCSLNRIETRLACADFGNGSVDVYAYPSIAYLYSITAGLLKVDTVVGVAYDPAAAN
jgi:hypothetical protein